LKDEELIRKQTYTKTEAYKLYSRLFWILLPNFIKIDRYNFELYRFKVDALFLRHSVCVKIIAIYHLCYTHISCVYNTACMYILLNHFCNTKWPTSGQSNCTQLRFGHLAAFIPRPSLLSPLLTIPFCWKVSVKHVGVGNTVTWPRGAHGKALPGRDY